MSESGQVPGWSTGDGAPLPPPPDPYDPYRTPAPPIPPVPPAYGGDGTYQYGVAPAPAYGTPMPAPLGTNGLAIASLVCSIVGTVGTLLCFVLAPAIIVGIVLGHVALSQTKRTGQAGRGLALGGVSVGYAGLVLALGITALLFSL